MKSTHNLNVLLGIQVAGAALASIVTFSFEVATVDCSQSIELKTLEYIVLGNFILSAIAFFSLIVRSRVFINFIDSYSEVGLIRVVLIYDIVALGGIISLTGGPENSIFTTQFMAMLPILSIRATGST